MESINNKHEEKKLVVYTALFGDYDELKDPLNNYEKCIFICFTDNTLLKSKIWNIEIVEENEKTNILKNRKYKILPHRYFPKYEYSLYVDANILIKDDPWKLVEKESLDYDLVIPNHFSRESNYDEAKILIRTGRVEIIKLYKQTITYILDGYISQTKMGENNIIFRKHNSLINFSEKWWSEFQIGVHRDQISLPYLIWKYKILYKIDESYSSRSGDYFELNEHKIKIKSNILIKILREFLFATPYKIIIFILKIKKNKLENKLEKAIK
jgi:hypothetical protein